MTEASIQLSATKQALLSRHLKGLSNNRVMNGIQPRPMGENGLSFAQQRLWRLCQLESTNSAYNISTALRITGDLNIDILKECVNEVVRRHEILRTTIQVENNRPRQQIATNLSINLFHEDLTKLKPIQQQQEIQRQVLIEGQYAFDLTQSPLLRVKLLALKPQQYLLLFTLHHIIADGWSAGILSKEFSHLYACFLNKQKSALPDLTLQYADFAYWQKQFLQKGQWKKQFDYWQLTLADAPALLNLPCDYPRPKVQGFQGAMHGFNINKALSEKLNCFSRKHNVTLFVSLLTVYNLFLQRLTGQEDLCIGIPVANRTRAEFENLIGFFVNTIVVRSDLSGNPDLKSLIQRVNSSVMGAQEHQDFPFDQLVEELKLFKDLSYSPVFQAMFVLHNVPISPVNIEGLEILPIATDVGVSKFDLVLHVTETGQGLEIAFEYRTDLFAASTINRWANQFQTLLKEVTASQQHRLSQLMHLPEEEKIYLLKKWNKTQQNTEPQSLLELFETQVKNSPEAIAVVSGNEFLSYRQLNQQANQMAGLLRENAVRPEVCVALCMERCIELLPAILAILKAGGCYVPIDPTYPQQRIELLLKDCAAAVLLSQRKFAGQISTTEAKTIYLDEVDFDCYSSQNLPVIHTAANAAYMIYTSGSTGKPKAVVISHQNATHSTLARKANYNAPFTGFLLLSSFAFDSSIAGLFWSLISGAKLCIPEMAIYQDPKALAELVKKHRLTHLLSLPSLYSLLLEQSHDLLDSLNTAIVAGESCPSQLPQLHYQLLNNALLHNEYGPTEASVWSTVHTFVPDEGGTIPIGKPISNTQIYLLDKYLNLAPIGVMAELYIAGSGIARGYYQRPDLTAERFIPNPFSNRGDRLYRTGDLVRYRLDGCLEFINRCDQQIKIRGFRVELSEIESLLSEHPLLQEAVVTVVNEKTENAYLQAYLLAKETGFSDTQTVKTFLAKRLPNYMLPSVLVFLDKLPLMPNGKLDRQQLPNIQRQTREIIAPHNEVETQLLDIWQDLLPDQEISIHDDFFELGGNSIMASRLLAKVQKSFNQQLLLGDLFEQANIQAQAKLLTSSEDSKSELDLVAEASWSYQGELPGGLNKNVQEIFITGANGFLGSFLLQQLLKDTDATLYCLIRASSISAATTKLQKTLATYGLWRDDFKHRLKLLNGDLAKPQLGLSDKQWITMLTDIDAIYHCGALVNFAYPYSALKPANVLGTKEIIRLASSKKLKYLHYISTLTVFDDEFNTTSHSFSENDFPELTAGLKGGYAQSKWVAEKMVRTAMKTGIPISIFRPGQISGHSKTGEWNTGDFICYMIKAYTETGCVPVDLKSFSLAPVDYVCEAIVSLTKQETSLGQTFHLNSPNSVPVSLLIEALTAEGIKVELKTMVEWLNKLVLTVNGSSDHPLYPLLSLLSGVEKDSTEKSQHFDCEQTQAALGLRNITCPKIDKQIIRQYLLYFSRVGFINLPSRKNSYVS